MDIELLPTIAAKSVRHNRRSYFMDAEGTRLPSVTTILNATKPPEARQALAQWRSRVGTTEATRIATTASRRGTKTHTVLKRYLLGEKVSCSEAAQPYWDSLQTVLTEVTAVRLVEGNVFHYDLGYAGKVDCIASYRGLPCVVDWKTSDRPKQSIDRLYDAPLQLAAYCGAVNHCYESMIKIRHALVVVAVPDRPAETFWLEPETLRHYWHHWQDRLALYDRRFR